MGRNSMRVDEGRISWNFSVIKMEARTVLGRGGGSLLDDPISGLRLLIGTEKDKGK